MSDRIVRLNGKGTLLSPLSHIKGREDISPTESLTRFMETAFITQDDDGKNVIANIPCYNGNAYRNGVIRRNGARWMLDVAGRKSVKLAEARFLMQGGSSLDKKDDGDNADKKEGKSTSGNLNIVKIRKVIDANPIIGLLGGTLPNRMLPGKARVSILVPVCNETVGAGVIPSWVHGDSEWPSGKKMLFQKALIKNDIAKDPFLTQYVDTEDLEATEISNPEESGDNGKKVKKSAEQKFILSEYLAAGTLLYSRISLINPNDAELGLLLHAFKYFSIDPYIGGQSSRGHGHIKFEYRVTDTGKDVGVVTVDDNGFNATGDMNKWMDVAEKKVKEMSDKDFYPNG